jgi:hypothetical protein
MDAGAFLQQNRKFLTMVGLAGVVFLVGETVVGSTVGSRLRSARGGLAAESARARQEKYGSSERDETRSRIEAATAAYEALRARGAFTPRKPFVLDPAAGSPTNQYLDVAARVAEDLRRRAAERDVELDERLGLPAVSPGSREEIAQTLVGLDLVERVVGHAIDAGVRRVEEIKILAEERRARGRRRADAPRDLDEVRIRVRLAGSSATLGRFLEATQGGSAVLPLPGGELKPNPKREGEILADLEFVAMTVREEKGS